MSRGWRDDVRVDDVHDRPREARSVDDARTVDQTRTPVRPWAPAHHLDLPRTDRREPVAGRHGVYHIRASEARLLATVGTFRSVAAHDLEGTRSGDDVWRGDLQRLSEQGLIGRTSVVINGQPSHVVTLTREGRDLLDAHRQGSDARSRQTYYADLVKPRELAHDAQLYRLFQTEAGRIEEAGGRIDRVVLDYELKRAYQQHLHRPDRPDEASEAVEMRAFADAWDLTIVDGHLELPDLRIEYETPDGRLAHRDVELVTEHYSRSQLAGKARAGFALYRAAGLRGGSAHTGGTPFDPHHLERV